MCFMLVAVLEVFSLMHLLMTDCLPPPSPASTLLSLFNSADTIILDYDGTIVDSMWIWPSAEREYLIRQGIEYEGDIYSVIGGINLLKASAILQKMFDIKATPEQIFEERVALVRESYREHVQPKEGFTQFAALALQRGKQMGVASMLSLCLLRDSAEGLGIIGDGGVCGCCVSSDECANGKPAPDIFLECMRRLGQTSPSKCLVIEDSMSGIQAAKAAGMKVIHICDRHNQGGWHEMGRQADGQISGWCDIIDAFVTQDGER